MNPKVRSMLGILNVSEQVNLKQITLNELVRLIRTDKLGNKIGLSSAFVIASLIKEIEK